MTDSVDVLFGASAGSITPSEVIELWLATIDSGFIVKACTYKNEYFLSAEHELLLLAHNKYEKIDSHSAWDSIERGFEDGIAELKIRMNGKWKTLYRG